MSDSEEKTAKPNPGTVGWIDMATENASEPVAGICHKKGPNADVPGGWMIYIHVDDLAASLASCEKLGGEKIGEVREMAGYGKSCVIKDPSGAMCVLFESL